MRKGNGPALADIDRAKTAFFSNVSHEFRTPLTLMLILEDELAETDDPLPPTRRERLEIAHRNSLRLLELVNSLLDFARSGRSGASLFRTDRSGQIHRRSRGQLPRCRKRRTDAERRVPAGARAGICGSGHVGEVTQPDFQRLQVHAGREHHGSPAARRRRGRASGKRYRHRHPGRGTLSRF